MSKVSIIKDSENQKIPEAPMELRTLLALNTAIEMAGKSDENKLYIEAALDIKTLADFK